MTPMKHAVGPLILLLAVGAGAAAPAPKKTRPKNVTTPSGLKYEEMKEGTGTAAKVGDTVHLHYTLWLAGKNKKVDSSNNRNPFTFTLGQQLVIKGFDEGVTGMKPGGKRKLLVPANLGYGAKGAGAVIPPNSDLVVEIELVKIIAMTPTNRNDRT